MIAEATIEATIADLNASGWVALRRLRAALPQIPADQLDRTLRAMRRAGRIALNPEMNQKALSDQDRAAAVIVGDTPNHLVTLAAPVAAARTIAPARVAAPARTIAPAVSTGPVTVAELLARLGR